MYTYNKMVSKCVKCYVKIASHFREICKKILGATFYHTLYRLEYTTFERYVYSNSPFKSLYIHGSPIKLHRYANTLRLFQSIMFIFSL